MARIRTIKPEFWSDEKMALLSPIDRLVFLGLVSHADDAGRLVDNIKQLDGLIFPETNDTSRPSIETLARVSRILRYTSASGQRLIQILNWKKHQKVDHASTYVLPAPSSEDLANISRESREDDATGSRDSRAPTMDHGPTTNDHGPPTMREDARPKVVVEVVPDPGSVSNDGDPAPDEGEYVPEDIDPVIYRRLVEDFIELRHRGTELTEEDRGALQFLARDRRFTPDEVHRILREQIAKRAEQRAQGVQPAPIGSAKWIGGVLLRILNDRQREAQNAEVLAGQVATLPSAGSAPNGPRQEPVEIQRLRSDLADAYTEAGEYSHRQLADRAADAVPAENLKAEVKRVTDIIRARMAGALPEGAPAESRG